MSGEFKAGVAVLQQAAQLISMVALVLLAAFSVGYTAACYFGYAEWLNFPMAIGDTIYLESGYYVQLGLTGFLIALCLFLPTNRRILSLENSHRRFHIGMRDVAQAYAMAHTADRSGNFNLKSEFDSVRARIKFLRDHPDLGGLEPDVLEVAAQMSHVSEDLATIYSDDSVGRAKDFLTARQAELDLFNERLEEAKRYVTEMRRWVDQVELDESIAESELRRLGDQLDEILPDLVLKTRDAGFAAHVPEAEPVTRDVEIEARDDGILEYLEERRKLVEKSDRKTLPPLKVHSAE